MVICAEENQSKNIRNITPGMLWWHCYTPEWNLPRRYAYRLVTLAAQRIYSDLRLHEACNTSFLQGWRVGANTTSGSAGNAQQQQQQPRLSTPEGILRFAVPPQEFLQEMVLAAGDEDEDDDSGEGGGNGATATEGANYNRNVTAIELPAVSKASTVAQQHSPPLLPQTPGNNNGAPKAVRIVWRSVPQFAAAAALVLQDGESIALAQHVLATVCRVLCEQATGSSGSVSSSSSKVGGVAAAVAALRKELFETRPDEVAVIMDHFLPSGQLVVINGSYYKHLKKESEALISSKT